MKTMFLLFVVVLAIAGGVLQLIAAPNKEMKPPKRSDSGLPENVFDVMPGQSLVAVALPFGEGPPPDGKMPTNVTVPFLKFSSPADMPMSMRWRITSEVIEDGKGGRVVRVGPEHVNTELVVRHINWHKPEFEIQVGEAVNLVRDFLVATWSVDGSGRLIWRLVNMGKIGDRSIWVLIVAGDGKEIADRLVLPFGAVSREIGFLELEVLEIFDPEGNIQTFSGNK